MNEKEFAELAAGHALHALSDADERRYADALAAHPQWQHLAAVDEETAAQLAQSTSPVAPPMGVRDALLAQIAHTPQDPASDSDADQPSTSNQTESTEVAASDTASRVPMPASRRRTRRLFALAASVALIVGVGIGIAALTMQLTTPASVIALEQIESAADAQQASVELASGATATAHWSPSSGQAVIVAEGLESLDEESTYQLWFVRGEQPVPAGLFQAESGQATALLEGAMHAGDAIAVTVEPAGGSPTDVPTTDPIIVIPTA